MSRPPLPTAASDCSLQEHGRADDATETTPLLAGDPAGPKADVDVDAASPLLEDGAALAKAPPGKPLPRLQIFLLCFARMMEPIAFFAIFPFIAQMVKRNGRLPDSDVGFYSGLIESLFAATQMVVLIAWGRLADAVGRKSTLIWSLFGMAAAVFGFTMSTTLWQMILFRCLSGVFGGSTLILRTMIADHSTPETQAVAFSWFAFAGNVGIFIGPILGGGLADPVAQYPSAFKGVAFFEQYPYALPGFAIAALSLVGIVVSTVFLEETLAPEPDGTTSTAPPPPQKLSVLELVKSPSVAVTIWVYTHVSVVAFAFTAILPIALWTPVSLGGMGFTPFRISVWMAIQGACQALWLLLGFPLLQRRMGTKRLLQVCVAGYPLYFVGYLVMNVLLRIDTQPAVVWFWIVAFFMAFVAPGVSMMFIGVQLTLNDVSPNPHVLGTLNALALTAASATRSFVPALSTVVYAIGVRNQIIWGYLAYVALMLLSLGLLVVVKWLPEDKKKPRNEGQRGGHGGI